MSVTWDHAGALDRVGGDEDLLRELIAVFFDEYPQLARQLRDGLSSGDLVSLRQAAHSLKGSLAYVGAAAAETMARNLEHACLAGDSAKTDELARTLMSEIDSLRKGGSRGLRGIDPCSRR